MRRPDFEALDIRGDGRLRYGALIDLTHHGQTVQFLSVQLKRGRVEHTSPARIVRCCWRKCPSLEGWIDAAAEGPTPFIVLGAFNRAVVSSKSSSPTAPRNASMRSASRPMPRN